MEKIITKNQVIQTIGTKLGQEFSADGFKYIKSRKELIRKNKSGFDKITLSTTDYYPLNHQILFIGFEKRIDNLENIVNQFNDSRLMNSEYHKYTTTIHFDYNLLKDFYKSNFRAIDNSNNKSSSHIVNFEQLGFNLYSENDIYDICDFLISYIRLNILPFFQVSNDLGYINKKLKQENFNSRLPFHYVMRSLVLMKLTNDPDYNILKEKYPEGLRNPHDDFGRDKIEIEVVKKLIDYLDKYKD